MAINVDGIKPGETIRAGWLNQLVRQLVSFFVAGRGIAIRMIGGKVMIECTLPDVRGRRSNASPGTSIWKRDTFNELVSITAEDGLEEGDLGYTRDQKVLYQYVGGMGYGWAVVSHHSTEVIP